MKKIKMKYDAWDWFGLSYADWLTIPRVALQSMPEAWQNKFFELLDRMFESLEFPKGYDELKFVVTAKKGNRFVRHILPHYKHNDLPMKRKYEKET